MKRVDSAGRTAQITTSVFSVSSDRPAWAGCCRGLGWNINRLGWPGGSAGM